MYGHLYLLRLKKAYMIHAVLPLCYMCICIEDDIDFIVVNSELNLTVGCTKSASPAFLKVVATKQSRKR